MVLEDTIKYWDETLSVGVLREERFDVRQSLVLLLLCSVSFFFLALIKLCSLLERLHALLELVADHFGNRLEIRTALHSKLSYINTIRSRLGQ